MFRERQGDVWQIPGIVDDLKEMRAAGKSFGLIADALSKKYSVPMSRNACIGKAHRMWGKRPSPPAETKEYPRERVSNLMRARLVRANGNSDKLKIIPSFYSESVRRERVADVVPLHVNLLDLQAGQCRYPYGDGPFTFCGCTAAVGSYCEPHAFLCLGDMEAYRTRSAAQQARRQRERAAA